MSTTTTGVAICIIKVKVLQRLVILLPPLSLFRFDATVTQYKKKTVGETLSRSSSWENKYNNHEKGKNSLFLMRHVSNSLMNWRYMYVSSTYVQYIIRSGVIHRIGCRQTQNTCMKSPTNLRVGGRIIFRIVMPSSESEQFFYFHCGLMLSFSNTNTASRWNVQLSLRFN